MTFTPQECVRIVKAIQDKHPNIIDEAKDIIQLPEPTVHYFFLLLKIKDLFCRYKSIEEFFFIGNHISRAGVTTRTTFIAVIYKLYNPEIFTNYYDKSKDNLRNELSGMLQCHPTTISQVLDGLSLQMKVYEEFRNEVNNFVDHVQKQIKSADAVVEQVDLFNNESDVKHLLKVG